MIINMEWGGFGDNTNFLPLSKADKQLDAASLNPGNECSHFIPFFRKTNFRENDIGNVLGRNCPIHNFRPL